MKDVDLGEPTSFLDHVYSGCTQISEDIVDNCRSMFESRISAGAVEKITRNKSHGETWCPKDIFTVLWHERSCKEMRGKILRLTSYIHHTCEYRQYCCVGNTAQQCRYGLFQDSDFAGDLDDSKSTSGGVLCVFRKPNICANKLDVQESNLSFTQIYEAEVISLDAGSRMDGIPALDIPFQFKPTKPKM